MIRRTCAFVLALALAGLSSLANALDVRPFDAAALAQLQAAGKPVAVHFHADWCPTCVNQSRALERLAADAQLPGMTVLVADYDKEKDLRRQLKGDTEVARSAGQTQPEQIRQALAMAL